MTPSSWRYAFASVIGTSHVKSGLPCQDACDCRVLAAPSGEAVLVAVVSDGAGSARLSQVGSQLACALFLGEIETLLETGGAVKDITRDFCETWLTRFQNEIDSRAEAEGATSRDFACTFLAAVVGETEEIFCQVGDGAIVVQPYNDASLGEYSYQFWPNKGEYENQTFFATDPKAKEYLDYDTGSKQIASLALFSDGLERLALHMESQTAHAPFFRPMFAELHKDFKGHSPELSSALAMFLASKRVQEQTDDDASLILATRLPLSLPPE